MEADTTTFWKNEFVSFVKGIEARDGVGPTRRSIAAAHHLYMHWVRPILDELVAEGSLFLAPPVAGERFPRYTATPPQAKEEP